RAGVKVLPMDVLNDCGLSDIQDVVALAQVPPVTREFLAAIVGFLQLMGLNHCAHGAVDNHDAAFQRLHERVYVGTDIIHSEKGFLLISGSDWPAKRPCRYFAGAGLRFTPPRSILALFTGYHVFSVGWRAVAGGTR